MSSLNAVLSTRYELMVLATQSCEPKTNTRQPTRLDATCATDDNALVTSSAPLT